MTKVESAEGVIETERLVLRKVTLGDVPRIAALLSDGKIAAKCAAVPYPYGETEAKFFVEKIACPAPFLRALCLREKPDAVLGVIEMIMAKGLAAEEVRAISQMEKPEDFNDALAAREGSVSCELLRGQDKPPGQAIIGYWLGEEAWGKGYMTEAGHAMIKSAFGDFHIEAVEGLHFVDNPGSGRVMEKLGFESVALAEGEEPIMGKSGHSQVTEQRELKKLRLTRKRWEDFCGMREEKRRKSF